MSPSARTLPYRFRGLMAALLCVGLAQPVLGQMVDLNGNGMSDIWELIYGASNLDPKGDADADGASNWQESIAGTDPFDTNSVPKITLSVVSGTNFNVSMPSALGKQYQLESVEPSGPGGWSNWTTEASLIVRTGSVVTLSGSTGPAPKLFRIAISDVDTDGDGVNDWEEYQLGLDPMNPYSNGQTDGNGQLVGDYAYVVGKLANQNVLAISATDPTAIQPDPGQFPLNSGLITITRGGFPLNAITVNLGLAGPGPGIAIEGVDHAPLPRSIDFPVGSSSQVVSVMPLADTNLMAPVLAKLRLLPGAGYKLGMASNASILIYPSATPTGTGLTGQYFTNSSATYSSSANFDPASFVMTRLDPVVDFLWGNFTTPFANSGYYTVRWTGQVQPQYSETYYFDANTDDGVKLWVNDQLIIDHWVPQGASDSIGTITLQAGVRYDIRMDYFQGGGNAAAHLYWYSPSQPKQVIPSERLYPASTPPTPTAVTSPLSAIAFLGQPFSFAVTGANSANSYTAGGLPPGLGFSPASGLISGTPNLAGDFQVTLTASNSVGLGASVLDLQVLDTGSSVVREVWLGAPGTNVADIPLNTPASLTNTLGTLEGLTDFGDNYGERIRGYLTAPVTGNYYFWLAASDSAELWISNDSEPVNKVKRAYVLPIPNPAPPPTNGTAPRQWNLQTNQRSGWLSLVAGQRYYLEILHKAGAGAADNWSVGWLQDPTGTNTTPAGVVPGYVLSRYYPLPSAIAPGALYTANLLPSATATGSTGTGSASLRLSPDGTQAVIQYSYSSLSSPVVAWHLHADPYLNNPETLLFDLDTGALQPQGTFTWAIGAVGTLSAADVLEIIREGKLFMDVHTTLHPDPAEIAGHFLPVSGTQSFVPPPPSPAWTDDSSSSNAAARFLIQATFGPNPDEVAAVQALGYAGWISNQFALPPTHHLPLVVANKSADPTDPYPSSLTFNSWWQRSVTAPDQLRQRVAFALSEIMVVSENGVLQNYATALSSYYDTLLDNAFGNFRGLLEAVTLAPAMGIFLDMRANDKGSLITGAHANENYAREVNQLFSVGLNRLWPDGTLVMDSQGNLVPTYDQNVVMGFASAFTGWNYWQPNQSNGRLPANFYPSSNYTNPMVLVPLHHDLGPKLLLDNVVLPPAWGDQANPASTNFDAYGLHDLELAHDSIFNNQNVGPFICRQLIQRLVTSNPSRDYLYRVVQAFNDNGAGVRGDMQAVIRAILLDYEARSSVFSGQPTFGKQREPLLRATATARAFPSPPWNAGTYSENGDRPITVTTTNAHRLNSGDTVFLSFTDTSGQPAPASQGYGVTVTSPTTFTVNAPGLSSGTYTQAQNISFTNIVGSTTNVFTTNTLTVSVSGNGLLPGDPVYLVFTTGGASNGLYQIYATNSTLSFVLFTPDSANRSGNCLLPKLSAGGYSQTKTNITVSISSGPHGLNPGDPVFIHFTSGSAVSGQYQVVAVPDAIHFTVYATNSATQTQNSLSVYPLVQPPLARSGNVVVQESTWNLSYTDSSLTQTPLRAPTVFNFFYPNFEFPGPLASAGLTTPEFQLTSDTTVAIQMNFLEGGLLNNGGNTNGLSSFSGGNGSIVLDLGPWMTPSYAANAGIASLVDALSSLLTGGQLSPTAKTFIVNYVANTANFPYNNPPSDSQLRDRVRAVVHLIVTSPDFTIQQ
ncbi:MAG TPA: DUF1800 family protein [Verrucomicrobiae bacterium]|nr:DUF1800 family protein [Verrucomicrobiae bacterium]